MSTFKEIVFNEIAVVSSIITIASFIISGYVWIRSDWKVRELRDVIRSIHDIIGTALWEASQSASGSHDPLVRYMTSIRKLTAGYSGQPRILQDTDLGFLVEENVLWSNSKIFELEKLSTTKEVWLVTPDLEPDASDEETGRVVYDNIVVGRKYVYFFPDDLPHKDSEIARLWNNIGLTDAQDSLRRRITLIPLNGTEHEKLFYRGNIILFFQDENRVLRPRCLEEVVLTKISKRGVFWQEHSKSVAEEIKHHLAAELSRVTMRAV